MDWKGKSMKRGEKISRSSSVRKQHDRSREISMANQEFFHNRSGKNFNRSVIRWSSVFTGNRFQGSDGMVKK
jgi:hypothetical protein